MCAAKLDSMLFFNTNESFKVSEGQFGVCYCVCPIKKATYSFKGLIIHFRQVLHCINSILMQLAGIVDSDCILYIFCPLYICLEAQLHLFLVEAAFTSFTIVLFANLAPDKCDISIFYEALFLSIFNLKLYHSNSLIVFRYQKYNLSI